jgi:two-component system, chemotaxis family, CheB/CheR fusion protein
VDTAQERDSAARRRIRHRMAALKISRIEDYLQYLAINPDEAGGVGRDIRVTRTSFFRDPKSFEVLKRELFPKLLKRKTAEDFIRIWVVGCATGQEAYSVAIALAECLERHSPAPRVQVFATDVDADMIQQARYGFYPEHIAAEVSPERLRRFFLKSERGYHIAKPIRKLCIFATHDLTRDPPFSKLDLICCRNLLSYLKPAVQGNFLQAFRYALRPEGYLLLGRTEAAGTVSPLFSVIDRESGIYRPESAPGKIPLPSTSLSKPGRLRAKNPSPRPGADLQREASRILLPRYAPAAAIINSDFKVQHFLGRTGTYFAPARGRASPDLLRMVRGNIARDLRTMVQQAGIDRRSVRRARSVESDGDTKWVNLEVVPLGEIEDESRYFMVIFEPAVRGGLEAREPTGRSGPGHASGLRPDADHKRDQLRQELGETRRTFRAAIKDQRSREEGLPAANDEILSANEDLLSANEELETAKEELQSVNEELAVLNQELQRRNRELASASDDLENLLRTVDIVLLLDNDLRVRRFTRAAAKMFGIMSTDAWRSLGELQRRLDLPDLQKLIKETLETTTPYEGEVRNKEGRWYSLRICPYKTDDGLITGAVLLLTDIDALKSKLVQQQQLMGESRERYQRLFERSIAAKFRATPQGKILECNQAFVRLCGGESREQLLESSFQALCLNRSHWNHLIERLKVAGNVNEHEANLPRKDGTTARVLMNISLVKEGETPVVEGSMLDITGPRQAEASLEEMARRLAEIQDEERQRFGRQLHDVVGSALVALNMNLASAQHAATHRKAESALKEAHSLGRDVLQQVRTLSYLLHPPLMHDLGTDVALRLYIVGFSQRAGIEVMLEMPQELPKLPPEAEVTLFRILQETLSNIHRHSGSKTAIVRLKETRDSMMLEVSDDGKGMSFNASASPGLGLAIVKERAQSVGGQFEIKSAPGKGTSITVVLPLRKAKP